MTLLFLKRDQYAVVETAKRYGRYVFRIAMNILGNAEDAEEVVNDVWQALWQSIPPQNPSDLMAYLARIARNLAYNRIEAERTQKRRAIGTLVYDELDEVLPSDDGDVTDRLAITKAINLFLASLEQNDRMLFVKRYFYNEGVDAIARQFQSTRGAVKVKLCRLRKQLKRYLEEEGV